MQLTVGLCQSSLPGNSLVHSLSNILQFVEVSCDQVSNNYLFMNVTEEIEFPKLQSFFFLFAGTQTETDHYETALLKQINESEDRVESLAASLARYRFGSGMLRESDEPTRFSLVSCHFLCLRKFLLSLRRRHLQ